MQDYDAEIHIQCTRDMKTPCSKYKLSSYYIATPARQINPHPFVPYRTPNHCAG